MNKNAQHVPTEAFLEGIRTTCSVSKKGVLNVLVCRLRISPASVYYIVATVQSMEISFPPGSPPPLECKNKICFFNGLAWLEDAS